MARKFSKEELIYRDLEKKKKIRSKIESKREIKHYRFSDFAQTVIGVGVFGLPALLNASFWDFLPQVKLRWMMYFHMFFIVCAALAINYQYRDDFSFDKVFVVNFIKRIFYVYLSVMIIVSVLLSLIHKITFSISLYDLLRNFFATQTVGMMGAVTFSFFKRIE